MSGSTDNPFGPPPKIFDNNTTSTHAPSLPFNTTNHLFSSTYANVSHINQISTKSISSTDDWGIPPQSQQQSFQPLHDEYTNEYVHPDTFRYHNSKKRKRETNASSERRVKRRIDGHTSNNRSQSHSQSHSKSRNRKRDTKVTKHSRSPSRSSHKRHHKHHQNIRRSYYHDRDSPSPPPKPPSPVTMGKKEKEKEKEQDVFDVNDMQYLQSIGFTAHGFATNVFSIIPLSNFGEDLYFPITQTINTNDYTCNSNNLFNMTDERKILCQQANRNERNMQQVSENIQDYINATISGSDDNTLVTLQNTNEINIRKSSKNKSFLPRNGKQILQNIMDELIQENKNNTLKQKQKKKQNKKHLQLSLNEKKIVCNFRYKQNQKVICTDGCVAYSAVILDRKIHFDSNKSQLQSLCIGVPMYLVHFMNDNNNNNNHNNNNNNRMDKWVGAEHIQIQENNNINYMYQVGDNVLCMHENKLYSAKITQKMATCTQITNKKDYNIKYMLHYYGWDKTWDKWVHEKDILPATKNKNKNVMDIRKIDNIHNLNMNPKHILSRIQTDDDDDDESDSDDEEQRKSKEITHMTTTTSTNNLNNNNNNNNIFTNIPTINISNINTSSIDTKSVLDQITQSQALKENYLLKQQIIHLQNELEENNKQLTHQEKKYVKKARKCKQYKEISKRLYSECIHGEGPRWHLIEFVDTEHRITRDSELAKLRQAINSLYRSDRSNRSIEVTGVQKWKNKTEIEASIKQFITLNGEYKVDAFTFISSDEMTVNIGRHMIEKFKINKHHRIAALNGQHGIRVLRDIPQYTCFGQYFGGEILQKAFGKVFDGTGEEHDHNIYAFDQKIDKLELLKINHSITNDIVFIIDPFIGDWKTNELLLRYVNDCRCDIDAIQPTQQDSKYYNVEFVGMKVNGWPQTYLMAKRDIKKGEELMTFYGTDFSNAIQSKLHEEHKKQQRKKRIDKQILQMHGIKL